MWQPSFQEGMPTTLEVREFARMFTHDPTLELITGEDAEFLRRAKLRVEEKTLRRDLDILQVWNRL